MNKSILIICRNNLESAPRFLMQVNALYKNYNIIAAGNSGNELSDKYKFIELNKIDNSNLTINFHLKYPFLLKKIISFLILIFLKKKSAKKFGHLKKDFELLKQQMFNLVIVHHMNDLPLGVRLARNKNVKLIFNAHEYYPLEFDDNKDWMDANFERLMNIGKKGFKYVDACFCVGDIIAEKYAEEFNIKCITITNSKPYKNVLPSVTNTGKIKLVHHGAALRSRKIELMIDVMKYLGEEYSLDLILVGKDANYLQELYEKAKQFPTINFPKAVSTDEISTYINAYDIGIYILPPTNFNNKYALPNKFFEFVQARLAIAIAPSPEMKAIVEKYDLGIVAESFSSESLAIAIKKLTKEKIAYFKDRSHLNAENLSSEKNENIIKTTVDSLIQ